MILLGALYIYAFVCMGQELWGRLAVVTWQSDRAVASKTDSCLINRCIFRTLRQADA